MEDWLNDLLENWGRWCRSALHGRGHCRSIEHRYRPEQVQSEGVCASPPDERSALEIERIVVRLPVKQRDLLRYHFARRASVNSIRRKLGIHQGQYEFELSRAATMVKNNLDSEKKQAYKSPQQSNPPSSQDEYSTLAGVVLV